MRLLNKWGVASIFSDGSMRKLLLFLCCALGWCGQVLSQRSVTDIHEAMFRLNEQLGTKRISVEAAIDSLNLYESIAEDSMSAEWSGMKLYIQIDRILTYGLSDNFVTADSLLHVHFLDHTLPTDKRFEALDALGQRIVLDPVRLFNQVDYEQGRRFLEFVRPYLPLSFLPEWQRLYAHSFLQEGLKVLFGDLRSFSLIRQGLSLAKEWVIPDLEVDATGALGVLFAAYEQNDSAYFFLEEADRLARLYELPENRFRCLDELSQIAWLNGDMDWYEWANARMDSLADFIQEETNMYRFYLHQIRRQERMGSLRQVRLWLLKAERWCDHLDSELKNLYSKDFYCRTATLYRKIGDLDSALAYGQKALQVWQQDTLNMDLRDLSIDKHPFAILGDIYKTMGDSARQFAYLDSLVAYADLFVTKPVLKEKTLFSRALSYYDWADYDRARKDFEQCLEIIENYFSDKIETERAIVLHWIGRMQLNRGEFQRGLDTLREVYWIVHDRYGGIPYTFWSLRKDLAEACRLTGHSLMGCGYWENYLRAARSYARTNFLNREPKEALKQIDALVTDLMHYVGYIDDSGLFDTPHVLGAYDSYLLCSLLPLDMFWLGLSRIKQTGNERHVRDYLHLRRLEALMDELLENSSDSRTNYEQLNHQIDSIRGVLRSENKAYGNLARWVDMDFEAIQNRLEPDECLLNVLQTKDASLTYTYYVFLVNTDHFIPIALKLPIPDNLISDQLDIESELYETPLALEFLKSVWEPIAKHIPEGTKVYYCSNEGFAPLALENIPIGKNSILGDRYRFRRISSPLSLFEKEPDMLATDNRKMQAVLYGGLRYDMTAEEKAVAELTYPVEAWMDLPLTASRGDTCFRYLPGTNKEVDVISRILTEANVPTIVRKGADGTEHSFLSMSQHAPNVLHLATHGFYMGPTSFQSFEASWIEAGLWSGLVLSGGNEEWRDTSSMYGTRGGLISSYEIAQLDFSNVDLLVLSACNTGKSVISMKGEIGLVSAFKSAGVKSVVMTLWEVSDRVTQEFMVKFYQELVDSKWDKRVAFEAAKAYIRKRYPEPVYWAGFVLVDG